MRDLALDVLSPFLTGSIPPVFTFQVFPDSCSFGVVLIGYWQAVAFLQAYPISIFVGTISPEGVLF